MDNVENNSESPTLNACAQYGREVREKQDAFVADQNYDFAPQFKEMTSQLYLIGAMWRFAENAGMSGDGRETAFDAFENIMVTDGIHIKNAKKRIDFLKKMSKLDDGSNALAVAVGYHSLPDDKGLVEVYNQYVDDTQVSGAFWRLYERTKKTMLYGGLTIAFIVIWFVTLFMPGNSAISILAAGLVSAAIFVIPVFLIGLLIYRFKLKKAKNTPEASS